MNLPIKMNTLAALKQSSKPENGVDCHVLYVLRMHRKEVQSDRALFLPWFLPSATAVQTCLISPWTREQGQTRVGVRHKLHQVDGLLQKAMSSGGIHTNLPWLCGGS